MYRITELTGALPKMLSGDALAAAMTVLPDYDEGIRDEEVPVRLMALNDLYGIYLPSQMSFEIYSKLYLGLMRSLQKKGTKLAIQQRNQNHRAVVGQEYSGILGGSDSFTIIGTSGIGKSSAIGRAMELIGANGILETGEPHSGIIPCLTVQTPFDCSVKGLLLEILRKTDERLDSHYYDQAIRARVTTDMLIGSVSQAALNHIGLLVVDEIQNVVNSKYGKSLVSMLTQLINNSGISICMVGTPESTAFFEQAMPLARRSLGLQYDRLEYGRYFHDFCCMLFRYQYVRERSEIAPAIIEWLYEHSAGVISMVVSLIHDAQEIAILNGSETLTQKSLEEAYRKRLSLLHGYIEPIPRTAPAVKRKAASVSIAEVCETAGECSIGDMVRMAKEGDLDIVSVLRQHIAVEEVSV